MSGIVTAVLDRLYASADLLIGVNERIEQMPEFVHEFRIAFHATYAAPPPSRFNNFALWSSQ